MSSEIRIFLGREQLLSNVTELFKRKCNIVCIIGSMSKNTKKVRTVGSKKKPAPAAAVVTQSKTPVNQGVQLAFVKPGARQVLVAGTFNDWKPEATPLEATEAGHWAGSLKITPGRHEYLFVVDGQWIPDPNAVESVQNPYGGRNSVLVVSE